MNKKHTQVDDVVDAMKENGGYATLAVLYQTVDFSNWKTKTPFESVRCFLQRNPHIFFKIQPGLWALKEYEDSVLNKFDISLNDTDVNKDNNDKFTHTYYQGLITEIGNWKHFETFVPVQDKNRMFLEQKIGDVSTLEELPQFTYPQIVRRASSVDVIWLNNRNLPNSFYEVEHTTNISNSLNKFYELQDFRANFYIVADNSRRKEFNDKINNSIYNSIRGYVKFFDYDSLVAQHSKMSEFMRLNNTI
ncbi:MAG: hypothetical protein NC452_16025 [Eubacterium sp.]|nr:hypothetical protein [Eubacterium sp.]